jgi:plasmid stability protein
VASPRPREDGGVAAQRELVTGAFLVGAIIRYHWRCSMTDVLVRDVPDDVIAAAVAARAARLGLSRTEYLRRRLAQEVASATEPVTFADLNAFAATFADLADDEVMKGAWD